MNRTNIINFLIKNNSFYNYLEIGVRNPNSNFNLINIEHKDGIDPTPFNDIINYPMTSDEFFHLIKNNDDIKYDIIFIDGLHLEDQVDKDIKNSLKHLSENGIIVIHDCNPITKFRQREVYEVNGQFPAWNGTVWKSWVKLRYTRSDLEMYVVDTDEGCGIIRKGQQIIWDRDTIDECLVYSYLCKNRKELLNLIDVNDFINIFKSVH